MVTETVEIISLLLSSNPLTASKAIREPRENLNHLSIVDSDTLESKERFKDNKTT